MAGDKMQLIKFPYVVLLNENTFLLWCKDRKSDTLFKVAEFQYGRRQSQLVKRAIEKHKKDTNHAHWRS